MRIIGGNLKTLFLLIKISLFLLIISTIASTSFAAEGFVGDSNLQVKGDSMEFKPAENIIIIRKNAKVKSTDFELECDELTVIQEDDSNSSDKKHTSEKIKELIALENVVIQMKNGYTAFSGRAEYFKDTQKIILKDNPVIRTDKNLVKGCIIIYHLDTGSYNIESCPDQQATGNIIQ